MDKQTFLSNGGLDFTVSKVKMHTYNTLHADDYTETPFFATVNDQTGQALGPVRSKYTVKQNAELLDVILSKIGEGNYDLEQSKCGTFNHGRKVFFFIKHVHDTDWSQETASSYVYALSSHDGSQRLTFGIANQIHSCSNMFGVLMADKENNHTIKHTKGIESINENNELDSLIKRNLSGVASIMNKMQEVSYDQEIAEKIFDLIANTNTKRVFSTTKEKRRILEVCTQTERSQKGNTYYGLFNGVTRYLTHHTKVEGTTKDRLTYNIAGEGAKISSKVLKILVNDMRDKGCLN